MLELRNIRKTFEKGSQGEIPALQGINLSIEEGSFVVILGLNGSGKSTLLNAVAGGFPIDAGKIQLDGTDITSWQEYKRAAIISRVFQNPFSGTAAGLSIAENLALASRRGLPRGLHRALPLLKKSELKQIITQLKLGLEHRIDHAVGTLSGGQRQALTLLMATIIKPRLLLLDEHTAALDPKSADLILRLSDEIVRRDNVTTMMVTHSMEQAALFGDRLIMMHKGKVVYDFYGASKSRLKANELLKRFEEIRKSDQLDEKTADYLRRNYI